MFGLFKSENEKLVDFVAEIIKRQFLQVLKEKKEVFGKPEDAVFFTAYFDSVMSGFSTEDNFMDWDCDEKNHKSVCDNVLKSGLWACYQRGQALSDNVLKDVSTFDVEALVKKAKSAAAYDCPDQFSDADNLYRYLTGRELNLMGE